MQGEYMSEELAQNVQYLALVGSRLYGTHDENSDHDLRGVFIPTIQECLQFKQKDEISFGEDGLLYDIRKFSKLLVQNNPNIIEYLFVPQPNVMILKDKFTPFINARHDILNPHLIKIKFLGFSHSEKHKITAQTGSVGIKRKSLVEKFGYNPKCACNTVRLLQQAIELVKTRDLVFPRPNVDHLLAIKNGYAQLDNILREIGELESELNSLPTEDINTSGMVERLMINAILN